MATTVAPITFGEFLELPHAPGEKLELIEGEVTRRMSNARAEHEWVKANLNRVFTVWVWQRGSGSVFPESMYRVSAENWPVPDLGVDPSGRLRPVPGHFQILPELVIEILSSETAAQLKRKIAVYFRFSAKAVLVADPCSRTIDIHHADGTARTLKITDQLELPDILPGFSVPVSEIFQGL